ncbi:hypothetical protein FOA52_016164 [Chlamydomonas sp. UWO 241]|nr:hypothetical protein FOA52_016164 [Chlamydomonas sp. UWO 241]
MLASVASTSSSRCGVARPRVQAGSRNGVRAAAKGARVPVTVTQLTSGISKVLDQPRIVIGSSPSADVIAGCDGVVAEHVVLERKAQQLFARAMVGEDMFDDSSCRLDGTDMRPRVGYLLGSGAVLSVGRAPGTELRVEFKEASGSNPMVEMMMQGMAASSGNADVARAMRKE